MITDTIEGTNMNDMPTSLAIIQPSALPTILSADKEDILGGLAEELRGFEADASTEKGRKEIGSKKRKVGTARQDLIRLAKTLTEDHQAVINGVRAEVKIVDQKMDELIAALDAPLEAYRSRLKAHEDAITAIAEHPQWGLTETAEDIQMRLDYLRDYPQRDWEEFAPRARGAIAAEIARTETLLEAAVKREAASAELVRLREAEAERQRIQAEKDRAEREARIAREAAEAARLEADREAAAAKEREADAERRRIAAEAKAEADRIESEAKMARMIQEKADADAKAERDRQAAAVKAKADAEAAAEAARVAERRRQEAEAAAEQAAADKRAEDVAHRREINRAAVAAIVAALSDKHSGSADEAMAMAQAIVVAIAKGAVPAVSIRY